MGWAAVHIKGRSRKDPLPSAFVSFLAALSSSWAVGHRALVPHWLLAGGHSLSTGGS